MSRRIVTTIAGRKVTLTRPNGKTQGWVVKIGHHKAGVLDWDNPTDRTWFVDLSDEAMDVLGRPATQRRMVIARGISREQAIRGLMLFYGWGNDREVTRIMDRDPEGWDALFAEAVETIGGDDDDAIADYVVARYPAYRRQQLTALYAAA